MIWSSARLARFALLAAALQAPPAPLTAEQWRADVAFLAKTLPERHIRPWERSDRAVTGGCGGE